MQQAAASSTLEFDWRYALENKSIAAATKTIRASEIDPTVSNKHSFHGIVKFRKFLGESRITYHTRFVYVSDEAEVFSQSFITWYDDCEHNPNPKCKNHWRIYYPDTYAMSKARTDDKLLVARMKDETLILVMTPESSQAWQWIKERYEKDERLETVAPPLAESFNQRALPQSFSRAKNLMRERVYVDPKSKKTFYCGCNYSVEGQVDPLSCGYKPKRPGSKRSKRLEWEHVVPASFIGRNKSCWKDGHEECVSRNGNAYKGRRCCNKVDKQFRKAAADLKNLVPAIGEINMDRSNFAHSEIEGELREYGTCDFEVNHRLRTAEPAVHLRGFIGRTWVYMKAAHELNVPDEDMEVYRAWADAYPIEKWELDRNNRIEKSLIE